jgi:HlyD family secretion protein
MEVTIDDEARTRVRHIYTVTAPITGNVLRISNPEVGDRVSVPVGDEVVANQTVVAIMRPMAPGFIDVRSREELTAAAAAAEAAVKLAEADVHRIEAALDFARSELDRALALADKETISAKALDQAKLDVATNEAALASAKAQLDIRRSEYARARARMIDPASATEPTGPACCIEIRAPASGRVLQVIQESGGVVEAGTPLLTIGDPRDMEVVADLLSTDAVQVEPGAPVRIEGWGGPPIRGRVTRVDPSGFTKVSALGIEEQRVRTIMDFVDPPEAWSRIGDDFRVIVHITVWMADDALTVPVAALFRQDDEWAVFAIRDGRAAATPVTIGHRNNRVAEVLSGLSAGDRVVLHPSDRVVDGAAVSERKGI